MGFCIWYLFSRNPCCGFRKEMLRNITAVFLYYLTLDKTSVSAATS